MLSLAVKSISPHADELAKNPKAKPYLEAAAKHAVGAATAVATGNPLAGIVADAATSGFVKAHKKEAVEVTAGVASSFMAIGLAVVFSPILFVGMFVDAYRCFK